MDRELLLIVHRLVKAYEAQADLQALALEKWRYKLVAIEGELLRLVGDDIAAELDETNPELEKANPPEVDKNDSW